MNLTEALAEMAHDFALGSKYALWDYAEFDPHIGYYDGNPYGTPYTDEGRLLYALVRTLDPQRVLEIGTNEGGSATHIAQALHDNGRGTLDTVDNREGMGQHIPQALKAQVNCIHADANLFILNRAPYEFIFEDGNHSIYQVELVWRSLDWLLKPGGMIVSHDAISAPDVLEGIRRAGYGERVRVYHIEPSPCGVAIWRKDFDESSLV